MVRIFVCVFLVSLVFTSCEESPEIVRIPGNPDMDFDHRILQGYFVKSIAFDSKGNAWIATSSQGLIKYNFSETVVYNSSNSPIADTTRMWDVAVDSKDQVWIGCEGIIRFDGTDFTFFNSQNTPIPEDFVHSIAIDSKDNIWFTSSRFRQGGLVKFDGTTWEVYTPDNSDLPVNMIHSIAIDHQDRVWMALLETVTKTYLVRISGESWNTYTAENLGFSPYYINDLAINSYNEVCASIDYSLSSTLYHEGPDLFVFDGNSAVQLTADSIARGVASLMVDHEDNIWCNLYQGYAVYNWENWVVNDSIFREFGSFTIEQAPDSSIWIGTGDGIYINH